MSETRPPVEPSDESESAAEDGNELLEAGMRLAYDDTGTAAERNGDREARRQEEAHRVHAIEHTSVIEVLRTNLGDSILDISLRELDRDQSPIHLPRTGHGGASLPPQVGRYRIAGEVARGGVGMVYRARDEDLGRDVAIKVLHDEFIDNPTMTCRFVEEAQVGGQLQHPGIVPVHELGLIADKRPYFAMKLVKGETLSRLLERRGDPSEDRLRFLGIFEQICRPLAYAHARGVIHRDLKPSNVMVGAFGEVQVMDWGLAKVVAHGGRADERFGTRTRRDLSVIETVRSGTAGTESLAGSILGTLAYMPPEQARGEVDSLDETADVFGLGAILCEMLTGDPPYSAASLRAIRRQAVGAELDPALERLDRCGADAEIVSLAKRCLALEPRDRPRDAGAVADEVSEYLQSLEDRAQALRIQAAEAEVKTREERKARRLTAALATSFILLLVLAAMSYLWWERQVEKAEGRLRYALYEARRRHATALASGVDREAWAAAVEAARATRSLAAGNVDEELGREVREFADEVESQARERRLAARLDAILDAQPQGNRLPGMDQNYADAFREFLDGHVLELPRDQVIERLQSSGVGRDVALALDDWALVRRSLGRSWLPIVDISLEISPDASRKRMWDAIRGARAGDLRAVLEPAAAGRVGARFLCSLARFSGSEADLTAELLERAVKSEPDSFRANLLYGNHLRGGGRHAESLPYLVAARALRPRQAWVALALGEVYSELGDYDAAFELFSESFGLLPHSWVVTGPLELLQREDAEISDDVLDRYIDTIRDVPEEEKQVNRRLWDLLGAAIARRFAETERERAIAMVTAEVDAAGRDNPYVLGMLARVQFAVGQREEAVRTLEEAMALPEKAWMYGRPEEGLLREYRQALLPAVVSYRSIDAALEMGEHDAVRAELARRENTSYLSYLEGRRLQHAGEHAAASELFREVLARDRSAAAPFFALWECLRQIEDVDAANAALRAELVAGAPLELVPIPPDAPSSLRPVARAGGMRLEASDFRCVDERTAHVATWWEVRPEDGEFRRTPVVDMRSSRQLERLDLPRHALRPRTRYFWRLSYIAQTGLTARSVEGSFTTGEYPFEVVPVDLARHLNRDVIVNPGDEHNDTVDDGEGALVEESYGGDPTLFGMPRDRRIGIHALASYDGPNAIQMTPQDMASIALEVPPRRFASLRFLVTGGHGDSQLPVTFEYADGTSDRRTVACDDWIDDTPGGLWGGVQQGVQPIRNGMAAARPWAIGGEAYAVFEVTLETDPRRVLTAIVLHAGELTATYHRTRCNLLAVTGVVAAAGGAGS